MPLGPRWALLLLGIIFLAVGLLLAFDAWLAWKTTGWGMFPP